MTMINIGGSNAASSLTNVQEKDVQPNAVDLRVDKILKVLSNDFTIDEDQKVHRGSEELEPDKDGYFHLEPGAYEVLMENIIEKYFKHKNYFLVCPKTYSYGGVFESLYLSFKISKYQGKKIILCVPFFGKQIISGSQILNML